MPVFSEMPAKQMGKGVAGNFEKTRGVRGSQDLDKKVFSGGIIG